MLERLTTPRGENPVVVECLFRASPERLFRAWTTPDDVKVWFIPGPETLVAADIDLVVGGRWRFTLSRTDERVAYFEGAYLEIVPNEKLVFSWSHVIERRNGRREETPPSRVTVTFRAEGPVTHLALHHEEIGTVEGRVGVGGGWVSSLQSLDAFIRQE